MRGVVDARFGGWLLAARGGWGLVVCWGGVSGAMFGGW